MISGAVLVVTLTLILPLPILLYWSLKVILEEIVSPDPVPLPLTSNATDKAPAVDTAIWELDDVKDATAADP